MAHATYEDSSLLMELYDLGREEKLRLAREWFRKDFSARNLDEFVEKCPPGSDEETYFRMVLGYWDMAAAFVVYGIVHEELFFECNGEMLFVWARIEPFIEDFRRMWNNPLISRNIERASSRYITWLNRVAPGAYQSLLDSFKPPH
jgi:hypothetical protein